MTTFPAEVVKDTQYEILPSPRKSRSGEVLASAFNPIAALTSVADAALDFASDIAKCLTLISIEKQKTEQTKAIARVGIEESRQRTERVRIQESEATERFRIQCKTNLEQKMMELEAKREEIKLREVELGWNHELYLLQLRLVEGCVESIIKDKDALIQKLKEDNDDRECLNVVLASIVRANMKLVVLSNKLLELQKR